MLRIQRIVSEKELLEFIKDPQYGKIVIDTRDNARMRDHKIDICLPVPDDDTLNTVRSLLKAHSSNPRLPDDVRMAICGFCGNYTDSKHISYTKYMKIKKIEEEYDLDFKYPKWVDNYLHLYNVKTDTTT